MHAFDADSKKIYLQKYKLGNNKIDHSLEVYLLKEIRETLIDKEASILELRVFADRINDVLIKYWNDFTVTEVDSEMLRSYERTLVLDLASKHNDIENFINKFDACVSSGHQVSSSCGVENSFKVINQLLKPNGIFCLDIWSEKCHQGVIQIIKS